MTYNDFICNIHCRVSTLDSEMFERMLMNTHLKLNNVSRSIVDAGLPSYKIGGKYNFSKVGSYWHTQGGNKRYKLSLEKGTVLVNTGDKDNPLQLIDLFMKHTLISSKRIITLLEPIRNDDDQVYLIGAMSYKANEDSGYGGGVIYATNNFNNKSKSRHDFVEFCVEYEDSKTKTVTNNLELGQCICFFQFEGAHSRYYVLVSSLEMAKNEQRYETNLCQTSFKRYKWQQKPTRNTTELIGFDCVNGAAFVIPDFGVMGTEGKSLKDKSGTLPLDWNTNPKARDRYYYINICINVLLN